MIMNGQETEGQIQYPSMQKCSWYAKMINKESDRLAGRYSAWCKPSVIEVEEQDKKMNEQDAMWETFDTLIPEESWVPSAEEKWLIDKIAQVLKELV